MKTFYDFGKESIPFTQIANDVLRDNMLSLEAKGLYAYLYSKPPEWQFSSVRIAQELKKHRNSIQKYLIELENRGLLQRIKHNDGRVTYWVTFPPYNFEPMHKISAQEPMHKKATVEKSHSGKFVHISNKEDIVKNIIQSNKEYMPSNGLSIIEESNSVYYGEFKNVKLKEGEIEKLYSSFGEKNTQMLIEELSGYIASKNKKYASHYATLLNWGRRKIQEYQQRSETKKRYIA